MASAEKRILVRLVDPPQALVLTVSNTGPGVSSDFSRDEAKGLGLIAIKVLARQSGGTIGFPTPGDEARFEIRVPH